MCAPRTIQYLSIYDIHRQIERKERVKGDSNMNAILHRTGKRRLSSSEDTITLRLSCQQELLDISFDLWEREMKKGKGEEIYKRIKDAEVPLLPN